MKKKNILKSLVLISIHIFVLGFSGLLFTLWFEAGLGIDLTFLQKKQGTILIGPAISFFVSIIAIFYFIKIGKDFFEITRFKELFKLVFNILYPSLITLVIFFSISLFLLKSWLLCY